MKGIAGKFPIIWVGLGALALAGISLVQSRYVRAVETARVHFIEGHHDRALNDAAKINDVLKSIHQNLSLLAALPGIRGTTRHGENISEETRSTVQQIYKNLANNAEISEIYVVPIDFDPLRIDPATLKKEAPIVSFDSLIVDPARRMREAGQQKASPGIAALNKTVAEVEDYEYAQFVAQANWYKANAPTQKPEPELNAPFISSPEIITCDNTQFILTGKDADRSGIIFSVPFYGTGGELKGMISGIMLSNALKRVLPSPHDALVNPGYNYANMGDGLASMQVSDVAIRSGQPDPALTYSEALPLAQAENRNPWLLWTAATDQEFRATKDVTDASDERRNSILIVMACCLAAGAFIRLARKQLLQARGLARSHIRARNLAKRSEAEARQSANKFQLLNEDISALNRQLADNIKQLSSAQEQAIKSGKMAQLGQLVATVAHEIRNPLAGIRTTLFTLKRRCTEAGIDADAQFSRIETGINRCDAIITQLLDFSRSQSIHADEKDIAGWLRLLITEFAEDTAPNLNLRLYLPVDELKVPFDAERLRRALVNLLGNARDALLSKNMVPGRAPLIEVELRDADVQVDIEVRDNGPGIPAEVASKIGEPFFTSKSFGSGLGVAAAKQVAMLHGGGLNFTSLEGQGATFRIWLPKHRASAPSAA